jgi:hypothetical protein
MILEMYSPNMVLNQNPAKPGYLSPMAVYLQKAWGGHLPSKDKLSHSIIVMAFKRQPSPTDQALIQIIRWGQAGCATPAPHSLASDRSHTVCWQPQIQCIQQNESFKGNAKWAYAVRKCTWSGIMCE